MYSLADRERSGGVRPVDIHNYLSPILNSLNDPPKLVVISDLSQAPEDAQEAAKEGGYPSAWYSGRYSDTIYVIASEQESLNGSLRDMVHELFHAGLKRILGPVEYEKLMLRAYHSQGRAKIESYLKLYKYDFTKRVDRIRAADEYAVHVIMNNKEPGFVKKLVAQIREALKPFLEKIGVHLKVTDNDILSLLGPRIRDYFLQEKPDSLGVLGWKEDAGAAQVSAWHGSPHAFDNYSTEKIGTGEGAQAFGYGLYFTDKKDIAAHYAKANIPAGASPRRTFLGEEL